MPTQGCVSLGVALAGNYAVVLQAFRVLTVVDQWSRWSPILEVAPGMSRQTVAAALERAIARHGKPRTITVDHALGAFRRQS